MTAQQIDDLCDEFEAALRRGDTTLIEDFLPKIDESQRSALLQELLQVEIQFAAERSPDKSADFLRHAQESLHNRFPDQLDLIRSIFRHVTTLRQIGDYEILGELGRGGMGTVYKAKHKLLQQTVAIKVLSQALLDDSQAVGRFKREMQLIGALTHPNIVRALNAGEIEGTHYLAMEFVEGVSLQKLAEIVRAGAGDDSLPKGEGTVHLPIIPLGAACEAIRQAAIGLQNVHELKLVHRDIKPANLMLDHRGTVKILDLGLGKFAEEHRTDYHSSLTMAGMVLGTVDYISPEQCENSGEADIRSDVYSLGCTLYFLLTGKPVYSGSRYDTMRKKLMAHIVGDVPSLRSVIPNFPPAIEAILQKALAKDPAERFQTPAEFAAALEPFASFDELWALTCESMPTDTAGSPSGFRHSSSPYVSHYSAKKEMAPPVSRQKMIMFFVGLNLLTFGLIVGTILFLSLPRFDTATAKTEAARKEAVQASVAAMELREQWKMTEAQAELQKSVSLRMADFSKYGAGGVLLTAVYDRTNLAVIRWYQGDSRRAGQDLVSLSNLIDDQLKSNNQSITGIAYLFTDCKADILERRADFILFGGAASGLNSERFADRISLYNEAVKIRTNRDEITSRMTRWKQAILLSLNGDLEKAEALLAENPLRQDNVHVYGKLLHQLAGAVLFYYQSEDSAERTRELRIFQRQFSPQNNATPAMAAQPEILELLLFCGEFLINDAIKHEEWDVLAESISTINPAMANYLRQYPGAIPFLRRFQELLIRSAVLAHDNLERSRDKQVQIRNIVRIINQMRPVDSAGMETPTLILFFLPESNKPEEGFVVFYPQDEREATLYPLPLTRQMLKREPPTTQREPATVSPVLPKELIKKIAAENKIRVSWNDESAWSSRDNALTDADYPYNDVLPLR